MIYDKFHGNDLEDKWVHEHYGLPERGVMVDVGAGPDGIQGSNSYFFEKNGWEVICVDGDPRTAKAIKKNRKQAHCAVITNREGKVKYAMNETTSDLSGLNVDGKVKEVDAVKLENLLKYVGRIDILSIDTEGTEIDAFESMDWEKHKPRILIIEFLTQGKVNMDIESYFVKKGYVCDGIVGPNLMFHLPEPIVRDPHLMVYGSSYDRGLEHLLKMWPEIKKEVPDAKLHVFYGWTLFDKVYSDNPERMAWKAKINGLMAQDGIIHLGRIGHQAVRVEMEKAGIWAYPTHFGEISCITAMKAQAWGAIPVVIDYAALSETVQWGIKIKGDIYDKETKDLYVKSLVSLLKDTDQQDHIRPKMQEWAKKFSWVNVADQWDKEFRSENSIDRQVEALMEDNQALKAWDLVKDTNLPIKDRVWLTVKHAFEPETYKKYYSEDLIENPIDEETAFNIDKFYPRFAWMVPEIIKKGKVTVLDLGSADGYLCLTLASKGLECTGVNLYDPSVKLANERATKHNVPAKFVTEDMFDVEGQYDVVVMAEILEHLPDPNKAISKAMSLCKPQGSLFITTPRTDHLGVELHKAEDHGTWDRGELSGHLRLFTEQELRDLLKDYKIVNFYVDDQRCMCVEVTR